MLWSTIYKAEIRSRRMKIEKGTESAASNRLFEALTRAVWAQLVKLIIRHIWWFSESSKKLIRMTAMEFRYWLYTISWDNFDIQLIWIVILFSESLGTRNGFNAQMLFLRRSGFMSKSNVPISMLVVAIILLYICCCWLPGHLRALAHT